MSKPIFTTSGWKLPSKIVVDKKDEKLKPNKGAVANNKNFVKSDGAKNANVKTTKFSNNTANNKNITEINSKNNYNKNINNDTYNKEKNNKSGSQGKSKKKGKKRVQEDKKEESDVEVEVKDVMEEDGFEKVVRHNKKKVKGEAKKNQNKTEKASKQRESVLILDEEAPKEEVVQTVPSIPKKGKNLSALQIKMAEKLKGSKFRILNEELYTNDSTHSLETFKENPELFDIYHQGFRSQVKSWPTNPVNVFAKSLKSMDLSKKRVVDLGCGDAQLSKELGPSVMVFSFDLVATQPEVIACDCTDLPIETKSVDVVVISLALMATNYYAMLNESARILKVGGDLLISEVSSRFEDLDEFVNFVVALGFTLKKREEDNPYFVILAFTRTASKFLAPKLNQGFNPCHQYTLDSKDMVPKNTKQTREFYDQIVLRYMGSIEKFEAVHNLHKKKGLTPQPRFRFSVEPPKLKACAYKKR